MNDEIISWRRSPVIIGLLVALGVLAACGMLTFLYGIRTEISAERQTATVSALTATPTSTPTPQPTPSPMPTSTLEVPASARTAVRIYSTIPQFIALALAVVFVVYMSRRRKA